MPNIVTLPGDAVEVQVGPVIYLSFTLVGEPCRLIFA